MTLTKVCWVCPVVAMKRVKRLTKTISERRAARNVLAGFAFVAGRSAATRHQQQTRLPWRGRGRIEGTLVFQRYRLATGLSPEIHAAAYTTARRGERRRRL